ncbi:MAG: DUF2764 family protein [Treponema sp.]|jgi:hypothetical protein|nr:DUF2764 family protein [Treponema sp.]
MAQLPYLMYEQKPPMSSQSFIALAEDFLTKKDAALLRRLASSSSVNSEATGCNFIDEWMMWDHALRLNLAKERIIKQKKENMQVSEPPVFPLEAAAAASKAVDEESPLVGEKILDKARWLALDAILSIGYFNRESVYAYYLKLLLLERYQSFNEEKGFAEYKSLYDSIVENAQNSLGELK